MKKQFLHLGKALNKAEYQHCEEGAICPETCVNGTCDGVIIV